MKYLPLLASALWRKPIRTVLTILAAAVAFLLFGIMHGVLARFDDALESMSDTRLRVVSRANIIEPLPLAHGARIAQIPGVTRVAPVAIFPAYYQELKNGVAAAALDVDAFLEVIPEIRVPPEQLEVMRRTRTGAIIGSDLADRYGWKIGDRVPLRSLLWVDQDGGQDWAVDVVAIANAGPDDDELFAAEIYFHYEYLDEARATGVGTVHQFIVAIDDAASADSISQAIDGMFANSSDETKTLDEKQYIRSNIQQVGDVRLFVYSILGAVLFTLLFLTGTAMMQSVRERIPELGVLKSVGFSDASVFSMVLLEALALCFVAAALGLGVAALAFPSVFRALGLAAVPLTADVYALGFGIAALLAFVVAFWPAWSARRLSIAEAISGR